MEPSTSTASILVVAALPWEARTTLGSLRTVRSGTQRGWRLAEAASGSGRSVCVLTAGIGPERAAAATAWALERTRPAVVLSIGCAGGLDPELRAGDVVVASEIRATDAASAPIAEEWRIRLWVAAERAGLGPRSGPLFSSAALLDSVPAKQAARVASGALAVEMEAAAIAAVADRAGLPFAAARAILDGAETAIVFARDLVGADGRLRTSALLRALLRGRGRTVAELAALGSARRICQRSLTEMQAALFRDDPPLPTQTGFAKGS